MNFAVIPLSLYIHIPWCVKKCPYCDFNSHAAASELPEKAYINQLLMDLQTQLHFVQNRSIESIFIGGGTPSLFSAKAYAELFSQLKQMIMIPDHCEITLEANPGTTDTDRFAGYFDAGINRISIGVQSFQDTKLKALGRIHEFEHAKKSVKQAQAAGFKRINIDLMFGLSNQTISDALYDLKTAIYLSPTHLSWYQLTLEPNTFFYRFPPILPDDDYRFEIQEAGRALLRDNHFMQYEISAYSKNNPCRHNLNYWLFGDYLGIGAGAHGKISIRSSHGSASAIIRRNSLKHPKQYLAATADNIALTKIVSQKELPLEFMMNSLRLFQPISIALFEARTGLPFLVIKKEMLKAVEMGFLVVDKNNFQVTKKGCLFLNELLEIFL